MYKLFTKFTLGLTLTAIAVFAQTKPTFEVATVKPAAPLDPVKMMAAMQGGGKLPVGVDINNLRAEYRGLDLKTLLVYAYGVKGYQITGPDWMSTERFDITAKLPDGATKDDAPKMLQSLLEDRFKLAVHRTNAEHPVLALVVGKGGPKLKPSAEKPVAIDETAELKPGEMKMDSPEGPIRMKVDMATGGAVIDMGLKGKMTYRMVPATQSMRIEFSMTTLDGFADMLTQLLTQLGGAGGGRQIVNKTDIQGNYDAAFEISLTEIMAMARARGMDIPGAPAGPTPGSGPAAASDPGGNTLTDAVQSAGLKLESAKANVEQLIVDHIEKTPTDN